MIKAVVKLKLGIDPTVCRYCESKQLWFRLLPIQQPHLPATPRAEPTDWFKRAPPKIPSSQKVEESGVAA